MFKKKKNKEPIVETPEVKKTKKKSWKIIGLIALFVVVSGVALTGLAVHQSNTNPEFCATCHIMKKNVTSYMTSNHMDNVHAQANVECKDCHDYSLVAEITSGINFVTGNYSVDSDGNLLKASYSNDLCFKCHIDYNHIASSTDYLTRNPHNNHNGQMSCKSCHISHGDQIDYCSTCHDNGGQRMVEDNSPRETKLEIASSN